MYIVNFVFVHDSILFNFNCLLDLCYIWYILRNWYDPI